MNRWSDVPVFGEPSVEHAGKLRPCAYAIIPDLRGHIALVHTPVGTFLPGGGIDGEETVVQAIEREALEECGLTVRVGEWIVHAVQFADSRLEPTCFEKRSTFVGAVIAGPKRAALEADHELVWIDPGLAAGLLSYESHAWAVGCWTRRLKRP